MKRLVSFIKDCHGSVTVMAIAMMFVFVGLLAYIIDKTHVEVVKNELQNAGDACALRGARAFLPDNLDPTGPQVVDADKDNAILQAYNTIADNKSDNVAFQLGDLKQADIQVGIWDYVNRTLLAWEWPPPASMWGQYIGPGISLPTSRNEQVSLGSVRMTLARIFGKNTVAVGARATAALSGVGGFQEAGGKPDFPICLNRAVLDQLGQGAIFDLIFGDDKSDNAGWTNLRPVSENDHTDANDIKQWFEGTNGPGDLVPGDNEVNLNNGTICSATKALIDNQGIGLNPKLWLVKAEGYLTHEGYPNVADYSDTNKAYVPDPAIYGYPWEEDNTLPTYTFAVCENDKFNQWHAISAVTAKLLVVWDAPDCTMRVKITGTVTALPGTLAGGPYYGVLSTEPKLTE